jgi:photosystem II stability/assembly factor-like uncharacterized protein
MEHRVRSRRRLPAVGILIALLGLGTLLSGCGAAQSSAATVASAGTGGAAVPAAPVVSASPVASIAPTNAPAPAILPAIRAARLITTTVGWALTDRDLRLTTTGGVTWTTVTPPDVTASRIRGATFLDALHGWVIVASNPDAAQKTTLSILRSSDGGRSWQQTTLAAPDRFFTDAPPDTAAINFLDAQHGWAVIRLASSSNFSRGRLFQTTDGGATWQQRTIPIGDPVRFVTPTDGWTAGGPGGGHLYVSRDGGQSWQPVTIAAPAAFAQGIPAYGLPTFSDAQTGVLPVTFAGDDASPAGLAFYATNDGGHSWAMVQTMALDGHPGVGVVTRTAILGPANWLVAQPGAKRLIATADSGRTTQEVIPVGLLANVMDLTFGDSMNGWARAADTECPNVSPQAAKGSCRLTPVQLVRTTDAGRTWVPIMP